MASYEKIIYDELKLHHITNSSKLVVPGQVQIRRDGRPLGRFSLNDVFDGDFANVKPLPPAEMSGLSRAVSIAYSVDGQVGVSGPAIGIGNAKADIKRKGAREIQITSTGGTIQEIDEGALNRALMSAKKRKDGPFQRNDKAVIIVAVASVSDFSIKLNGEGGARLAVDTDLAATVSISAGVDTTSSSESGLVIKYPEPIPFAARLWLVKEKLLGGFSISTPKGPLDILGSLESGASFTPDLGLRDREIDLD